MATMPIYISENFILRSEDFFGRTKRIGSVGISETLSPVLNLYWSMSPSENFAQKCLAKVQSHFEPLGCSIGTWCWPSKEVKGETAR
jgi:hypothetical protein